MDIRNLIIIATFIICLPFSLAAKTRIKDITGIEGVRDNLLVGQGLVVGLNGTGDKLKNSPFTEKGLTDFLERLGVNVQGAQIKTKNIAAVTVTANLPPFARMGTRINVKVSTIADAKSLNGGTLLATPLIGADGTVYAVAQGSIVIPEFAPASGGVKTKSKAVETNAYIQNGAIVENEIDFTFTNMRRIKLFLYLPDFGTSVAIAAAINNHLSGNTARALDSATVEIVVPTYRTDDLVEFIAEIESLEIKPDYKAKIVINESTGTVVIGDKVHIRPVAIAQGNLVVNVGHLEFDKKYGPETDEETRDLVNGFVEERRGRGIRQLEEGANLSDLVAGLNRLGVYPRDIINILHNMKSVGALDAVIEVR
ncbi:MAG: flagellar biosynthesis protein FlgA [Rickettsiales bacterium]|nr:MAG: flagellar biosynthesis protein FlgA [Rickettsiales bacterium]